MIEKYIDEDNMIKMLQKVIAFKSVKGEPLEGMPYGEQITNCLNFVLDSASDMGFDTKNIDNQVGYVEYGDGEEMIGILGHLDVVPEGDGWTYPAYGGQLVDGKMYGRGTMDDKGPMISALYALKAIKDSGTKLKRRVRIIFGTDEESGSKDMVRYKETEEFPVMAFTPDADYPVIFSEKGLINFTLRKKLNEDRHGGLTKGEGGKVVNQVPDTASFSFSDGSTIEATGKAAHGGSPEDGINAIDVLINRVINCEKDLSEDLKQFINFYCSFLYKDLSGEKFGISYKEKELGGTTLNVGLLCADCNQISVTADYRYPYGFDIESSINKVKEIARDNGITFELTKHKKPLYFSTEEKLVKTLQEVYNQVTNSDTKPIAIGGGTYAKSLPNTVAFGPIFPGRETVIHQKDEYISIEDLALNTKIMLKAMCQLANM